MENEVLGIDMVWKSHRTLHEHIFRNKKTVRRHPMQSAHLMRIIQKLLCEVQ